jgi:flagellar basal body rod protein FlgG
MGNHATGTFEVKLTPEEDKTGDAIVGRMTIDKQFQGDIKGTSKGLMVMTSTAVQGSAGYVALEKVNGSINDRKGTFYLQHHGIMNRGEGKLLVVVVPDSGTDELTGLAGSLAIKIENGKHYYDFEYTIDASEPLAD